MQEAQDCPVCSSPFTSVTRRKVVCPMGCGFDACAKCVKDYLVSPMAEHLACMNPECRGQWTVEFLNNNIWSSEAVACIRKNQRDIAVSLDRSRRVEALELVAAARERKRLIRERDEISAELAEKERALSELREKRRRVVQRVSSTAPTYRRGGRAAARMSITWEYPCSVPDCRGLVASSGQCHVCETWICKQCGVPTLQKNDESHTCKQEDIDTARELRNNTKPCPKCATLISRTEGCPQMHCVACRTNFDWNSGRILEARAVMNPHLEQWRRENPGADPDQAAATALQQQQDGVCASTAYGISDSMWARRWPRDRRAFNLFLSIARCATHAQSYARDVRSWIQNTKDNDKTSHGVKFFLGESSEAQWENAMKRSWEKHQRVESAMQIWQTFYITISDTFRAGMREIEANDSVALKELLGRLIKIRDFTNDCFRKCNPIYGGKLPQIEYGGAMCQWTEAGPDWKDDKYNHTWQINHFGQPVTASLP